MTAVEFLEERHDLYVIRKDGGLCTIPKTPYYTLKYKQNSGGRIFHTFDKEIRVEETFNDGIFNVYIRSKIVQMSDADSICRFILSNDTAGLREVFDEWYEISVQSDVLRGILARYPHRVDMSAEGRYVVDGVFCVDHHGTAKTLDEHGWRHLCIVADMSTRHKDREWDIGGVRVTGRTMTVLSKIMFLLNPDKKDTVFMDQLHPEIRKTIKAGRRPAVFDLTGSDGIAPKPVAHE